MSTVKVQSISEGLTQILYSSLKEQQAITVNAQFTQKGFSNFFYSVLCLSCASHACIYLRGLLILLLSASNLSCDYLVMIYGNELMGGCRVSWWLWFPIFKNEPANECWAFKIYFKKFIQFFSLLPMVFLPSCFTIRNKSQDRSLLQKGLSLSVL